MKNFFIDKFEYNHSSNFRILNLLKEKPEAYSPLVEKLVNHSINAHHVWTQRILNQPEQLGIWEISEFQKLQQLDDENFHQSLEIIQNSDLKHVIEYKTSKGEAHSDSIEDILFHILNHTTYHRGQIMTAIKNTGETPISTDFIFYKR